MDCGSCRKLTSILLFPLNLFGGLETQSSRGRRPTQGATVGWCPAGGLQEHSDTAPSTLGAAEQRWVSEAPSEGTTACARRSGILCCVCCEVTQAEGTALKLLVQPSFPAFSPLCAGKRDLRLRSQPAVWLPLQAFVFSLLLLSRVDLFRVVVQIHFVPFSTSGLFFNFLFKPQQLREFLLKVMTDRHFKPSVAFPLLTLCFLKRFESC